MIKSALRLGLNRKVKVIKGTIDLIYSRIAARKWKSSVELFRLLGSFKYRIYSHMRSPRLSAALHGAYSSKYGTSVIKIAT